MGLLLGVLAACGSDEIVAGVTDSTFVAVMAELQRIQTDSALSQTARDSATRAVLDRYELTAERLKDAARTLAGEPERAFRLVEAVQSRVTASRAGSAARADTARADTVPADTASGDTARADTTRASQARRDSLRRASDSLRIRARTDTGGLRALPSGRPVPRTR